jgi:hypothetical protein
MAKNIIDIYVWSMNAIPPFNTDFVDFSSLAPVGLYISYKGGRTGITYGNQSCFIYPCVDVVRVDNDCGLA